MLCSRSQYCYCLHTCTVARIFLNIKTFVTFYVSGIMSSSEESVEFPTPSEASGVGYNDIVSSILQLSDVSIILLHR